jgi:hypothetical protein
MNFTNFAYGTLTAEIAINAASLEITTTENFPQTGPFRVVIWAADIDVPQNDPARNIKILDHDTGDVYTISNNGAEGTSSKIWPAGSKIAHIVTAAELEAMGATAAGSTGDLQINIGGAFAVLDGARLNTTGNARGACALDLQSHRPNAAFVASGAGAVAVGLNNRATEEVSAAVGYLNQSLACSAFVSGHFNIACGPFSTASGYYNFTDGRCSSAFGALNSAQCNDSLTYGYFNTASAYSSAAFGHSNCASNVFASAFGVCNHASGLFSSAFGAFNTASGCYGTALGNHSGAEGPFSVAMGNSSFAYDECAVALGNSNSAYYSKSAAVGIGVKNLTACSAEFGAADTQKIRVSSLGFDFINLPARPASLADSAAPNNALYYSTTQSKLSYKDGGGTVHVLY